MLTSDDQGPDREAAHATEQQHALNKDEATRGGGEPTHEEDKAAEERGDDVGSTKPVKRAFITLDDGKAIVDLVKRCSDIALERINKLERSMLSEMQELKRKDALREKELQNLRQEVAKHRESQLTAMDHTAAGLEALQLGRRNTDKDVELLNSDIQSALDMIKDLLDQSGAKAMGIVDKKRAKGSSNESPITTTGTATINSGASTSSSGATTTTTGNTLS